MPKNLCHVLDNLYFKTHSKNQKQFIRQHLYTSLGD